MYIESEILKVLKAIVYSDYSIIDVLISDDNRENVYIKSRSAAAAQLISMIDVFTIMLIVIYIESSAEVVLI